MTGIATDLIERVARALLQDRRNRVERIVPRTWENLWADEREDYYCLARAALTAANVEGLVEALRDVLDTSGAREAYHALKYAEAVERAEAILAAHIKEPTQ